MTFALYYLVQQASHMGLELATGEPHLLSLADDPKSFSLKDRTMKKFVSEVDYITDSYNAYFAKG